MAKKPYNPKGPVISGVSPAYAETVAQAHDPAPVLSPVPAAQKLRQAFTVERVAGGWVLVTLNINDAYEVVSVEKTVPDLKAVVLEKFKIASFKYWSQW